MIGDGAPARQLLLEGPARFAERRPVRFQEVDAAGIVFFPRMLEYFHDAYVSFLEGAGCPLHQILTEGRFGLPLRHVEAEFLRPLRFGDEIEVALVAAVVSETDFTLGHRITLGDKPAVIGRTLHVTIDRPTFRRTAIPDPLRRALATLV